MSQRIISLIIALMSVVSHIMANESGTDTIIAAPQTYAVPQYSFRPLQVVVPAGLIAAGSVISATGWLRQNTGPQPERRTPEWVDGLLEFTPLAAGVVLGFAGVPSPYTINERMASRVTAALLLQIMVQPTKRLVHSWRPDRSDTHSFPSGHTAVAFMGAELMRIHYGPYWAIGGYAAATACAVMRCVNNHHWPADVIAGAGFGILAANAAMWLLPLECKLMPFLTKGRKSLVDTNEKQASAAAPSATLLPSYSPHGHTLGVSLALTF